MVYKVSGPTKTIVLFMVVTAILSSCNIGILADGYTGSIELIAGGCAVRDAPKKKIEDASFLFRFEKSSNNIYMCIKGTQWFPEDVESKCSSEALITEYPFVGKQIGEQVLLETDLPLTERPLIYPDCKISWEITVWGLIRGESIEGEIERYGSLEGNCGGVTECYYLYDLKLNAL